GRFCDAKGPPMAHNAKFVWTALVGLLLITIGVATRAADVSIRLDTKMTPPRWAVLERQLLADNLPAAQEFYKKYFDDRGHLQIFVRWGAKDGPDDAF